jgi:hypothetical protein
VAFLEDLASTCAEVLTLTTSQYNDSFNQDGTPKSGSKYAKCDSGGSIVRCPSNRARALTYSIYLHWIKENAAIKADRVSLLISFEKLPADKFVPERDDILESVQLDAKYKIIRSWIVAR